MRESENERAKVRELGRKRGMESEREKERE